MSEAHKAVFLSYASQDVEAAKRIADALRGAGVEVWFDQSELVGGDAWDAKIRKQIGSCALFMPVISAHTEARAEGYFRLEWRLADKRTELMGKSKAFLLPVCIDDTRDAEADVPDSFTAVQWTRLKGGETTPAFVARVQKLLSGSEMEAGRPRPAIRGEGTAAPTRNTKWWWALPMFGVAMALLLVMKEGRKDAPPPVVPEKSAAPLPAAQVVPLDPKVAEARALLAKAQPLHEDLDSNTRTDYELAEELIKRALELAPLDAEVWAHYSWFDSNYVGVGLDRSTARLADIKRAVDRAMTLDPKSDMVQFAWANYYRREPAMAGEAVRVLQELVDRRPDFLLARRVLALVLTGQKKYDEALAEEDYIIAHFPKETRIWTTKAGTLAAMGRPNSEVEAAYDASLAIKPTPRALIRKAMMLADRADVAGAAAMLDRVPPAFQQEDRMVAVAVMVALAQRQPARVREILTAFPRDFIEEANLSQFNQPKAWGLGFASWIEGKPERARLEWQEALRVVDERLATRRTDARLHFLKTILHAMIGQEKEAEAAFRVATQMTREGTSGLRARIELWSGRPNSTLDYLEKVAFTASGLARLRADPVWAPLWGNPRFEALRVTAVETVTSPAPAGKSMPPKVDEKSVAVLAFANLSDDKANEYFSDGISDDLLNVLAKVPGLKVSARTSSFYFKGKQVPMAEIAQQLGVAYVVEGSVRKSGDKVRITAQLIKAADGFQVWSDTFTRDLKDIFAVQDEIAGLIATNLSLKLNRGSSPAEIDPEFYGLFLAGRQALDLRTFESFDRAEALFTQVIERAPKFARAYSARAETRYLRAGLGQRITFWSQRDSPILASLEEDLDRALQLEPDLPEAVAVRGLISSARWRFDQSVRDWRRAIELNPNYAQAHLWLGIRWWAEGRVPEARAELLRAAELDPMSGNIAAGCSAFLFDTGYAAESLAQARRAVALQPNGARANMTLAHALALNGRSDEAVALTRKLMSGYVGSSRVDLQACKLEYSIVSPK